MCHSPSVAICRLNGMVVVVDVVDVVIAVAVVVVVVVTLRYVTLRVFDV